MIIRIATALLCLALAGVAWGQASPAGTVLVGQFSAGTLAGWEAKIFKGKTKYAVVSDADSKATVLRADANATASGLFKKIKIDLTKTPFLNWSWRANNIYSGIDEGVKVGDDFPSRIYVVVERGLMGMRSLSLNYVWASQHPVGSLWPSPFTYQVQLLALDSGVQGLGTWIRHKRDLRVDLRKAFGEDIIQVDAVALMTDADNHGGRATSFYGDIWFSAE